MTVIINGTDNSASTPAVTGTDGDTGMFYPAANTVALSTGGSERMRVDSSGNVGIGTSSPGSTLNLQAASCIIRLKDTGASDYASIGTDDDGSLSLYARTAAGIVDFRTNNTERMRITSAGLVGVATSSPTATLDTYIGAGLTTFGDFANSVRVQGGNDTNKYVPITFGGYGSYAPAAIAYLVTTGTGNTKGDLVFGTRDVTTDTRPTERMRITSGGYVKASNTGTYINATGTYNEFYQTASNNWNTQFTNSSASGTLYGVTLFWSGQTPNNTTSEFFRCEDATNTKLYIYSNGTVSNRTGTYNTISDAKIKQDITDANSQWDDIKAIKFRKYRLIDDVAANPDAPYLLGVVAQELEQTSPGLIDNTKETTRDEDGNIVETNESTKSVKTTVLLMKAAKALQEAMIRIETLEAQNTAFEARIAALEVK